MRKISSWAKEHAMTARLFIVLIKGILIWMAWITGLNLLKLGLHIPVETSYEVVIVLIATAVFYPSPKSSKKRSYFRRKSCDFILSACSFMLITTLVNTDFFASRMSSSYASTAVAISTDKKPTAEEILNSLQYRDKHSLSRMEKRILKKEFNQQLKKYIVAKATGNRENADKSLLIILTIIGAIGLTFLLMGLVCSLSCNGAEAAAVVLGIVGITGIVIGTVLLVRSISRGPRKNWKM